MIPLSERASALVRADDDLMTLLLAIRIQSGLSAEDVAERMGVSPETVKAFERYDANPTLGIIRRYALSVGAHVEHKVSVVDVDAAPVIHFAPYGSSEALDGTPIPNKVGWDVVEGDYRPSERFTVQRDKTTCPRCLAKMTGPIDSDFYQV